MIRPPRAIRCKTFRGAMILPCMLISSIPPRTDLVAAPPRSGPEAPTTSPPRTIDPGIELESLARFSFDPGAMPIGTVFFYRKSNIDGSHASTIATYVTSETRIESLKWTPGGGRSTLVAAEMDWDTQSVKLFQTWHVFPGSRREHQMIALTHPDRRMLEITSPKGSFETPIVMYPWHNYDFDFASLALSMRHLTDPEHPFTVGIIDRMKVNGEPAFGFKGTIEVSYVRDEERHGFSCRKYRVDGSGLEDRGGLMWFDKVERHLIDYEIALPDEPGYESGKLQLQRMESITPAQWDQLVDSSVTE